MDFFTLLNGRGARRQEKASLTPFRVRTRKEKSSTDYLAQDCTPLGVRNSQQTISNHGSKIRTDCIVNSSGPQTETIGTSITSH